MENVTKEIKRALLFAGNGDIRGCLNTLCYNRHGLCATDGHRLYVNPAHAIAGEVIYSRDTLEPVDYYKYVDLTKVLPTGIKKVGQTFDRKSLEIRLKQYRAETRDIERQFRESIKQAKKSRDYKRELELKELQTIHKQKAGIALGIEWGTVRVGDIAVNVDYIIDAIRAGFTSFDTCGVGQSSTRAVYSVRDDGAFCVIMPMRI